MKRNLAHISGVIALIAPVLFLSAQDAPKSGAKTEKKVENFRRSNTAPVPELAPQRVILGWTGDPSRSRTITWRTEKSVSTPQVEFARGDSNPAFANGAKSVPAKTSSLDIFNGKTVAAYRVSLDGLTPGTQYLYRVGDGMNWGEWNGFRTAADRPEKFKFIYVGDAQNDIKSLWSRTIRTAYSRAPRAAFVIHAGDLVSSGFRDDLWGEWYDAMGFIAANIPMMAVPVTTRSKSPPASPSLYPCPRSGNSSSRTRPMGLTSPITSPTGSTTRAFASSP